MVGAPGAGKGTQAAALAKRLGIPHVASGDLFREQAKRGTVLGKKVKTYLDRGALVPDDITVEMIKARLAQKDAREGAILDGFPRTRPQAEALDKMLDRLGGSVAQALYVDVDREQLIKRLSARQREDDKPATIRARLEQQLPPMFEVIDYYTDRGVLSTVQGDREIDAVTDELMRSITQPAR